MDTRFAGDPVTYGTGTYTDRTAFGVNWVNVDYFESSPNHTNRNSFQLLIVDRSDVGVGDFDFIFNYDLIQWETGQASGGDENGRGGDCARAGWSNGSTRSFELPGSAVCGAFLDSGTPTPVVGPHALINNRLNSDVDGRYIFNVRNGQVQKPPRDVPEPATLALLAWAWPAWASCGARPESDPSAAARPRRQAGCGWPDLGRAFVLRGG